MFPFIVCYCGRSIGDLYDAFSLMKAAAYKEFYELHGDNIDPERIPISESVHLELNSICEQLGLTNECCKIRMLCQVTFKEVY